MLKLRKNKKGFTLVELIVVIAIMAVLAGTVAGVTVSQLNKQTNNSAQSEVNTLMEDFKTFLLDYQLPTGTITGDTESAPTTIRGSTTTFTMPDGEPWNSKDGITNAGELTYAIMEFAEEAKVTKGLDYDILTKIPDGNNPTLPKAGTHKFVFAVTNTKTVTFSCQGKGTNAAVIKAEYTYSDVLEG